MEEEEEFFESCFLAESRECWELEEDLSDRLCKDEDFSKFCSTFEDVEFKL